VKTLRLIVVLAAAAFAGVSCGSPSTHTPASADTALCPFPLEVTVTGKHPSAGVPTAALKFSFTGPSTITLRNTTTGRTATLDSSGSVSFDTTTGSVVFSGHQIWFWSTGKRVPFLSTDGAGRLDAPDFVLSTGKSRAHVIDPCALVAPSPPSTKPVTTPAPWRLPMYSLSQMKYAGLTPVIGQLVRHDHVHVDLIVNGKKITIPAGVGLAEPVDRGPCQPVSVGDCGAGDLYTAAVANSPLHTHGSSGLIHVEPDRPGTYTLGEFFDEWGVRLSSSCIGGYCTGNGKELRAFVDGHRVSGDPRNIVLTDHQEIAIVYGGPRDFGSVPSTYKGGWPGLGCGGVGEFRC
jgi:hypothetical protein